MIKEWIADYNPANQQEAISALREIMQEVALAPKKNYCYGHSPFMLSAL